MGLGWQELLIILAVALLLFGGSRLAGIGKASGRAIREFKEETRDLKSMDKQPGEVESQTSVVDNNVARASTADPQRDAVVDAEVVNDPNQQPRA